jgi:hypothetical protein
MSNIRNRWPEDKGTHDRVHDKTFGKKKIDRPGKTVYVMRDGSIKEKGH